MYFEDVEEGNVYKSEGKKPITGTEIDIVAQLSGFDHPIFLDPKWGEKYGFKDRPTPGPYVLLCMFALLVKQGFLADAIWLQSEGISLKTPAFPGDQLSAESEVINKKEAKGGGGPVTYKWRVTNQDNKIIAEGKNT